MDGSSKDLRRFGLLLVVAVSFGVGAAILKGNGAGIRDALGNASAPWLLLPFMVGIIIGRGRLLVGAGLGLLLSLIALAAFYVTNTFVLQLGPHPWLMDLRLTLAGGQRFFMLALLSGPVFGALGAWWTRTKSIVIPLSVAALFMLEPVAELTTRSSGSGAVWVGEVMVGVLAAALVVRLAPRRTSAP